MTDIIEEPNILDEPLHGLYIPTGLFFAGIALMTYMSGETRLLFGLPLIIAFVGYRAYGAYGRKNSILTDTWTPLELQDKTVVSKNTAIYRFKLKSAVATLDLPPGHFLMARIKLDGVEEVRNYNPISPRYAPGYFDLMVKSYVDGKVSRYLAGLNPGETVDFRGPIGQFHYSANASRAIGLVAGGSGITPMLQILNEIVTSPEDMTKISLIYANNTENDILLKDELDELAATYPHFTVHYVLTQPPNQWKGYVGYVSEELMRRCLPAPSPDHRLVICGPEGMNALVLGLANKAGWSFSGGESAGDDQVFVF
ncbi:PGA3 (YML125C) and AIM33 (YML087C) [Zygosaccharomyces parabailii]|nr:PGA3 (YML125C) and AIM33 (YML087C) [Zygosaccharomyces parabailii]CDH16915.1 probable Plasma membrane-associated coenzyme Q6 reductase PGA3 [Zygosaccharomyces bailii ISA1307]SJM87966.1 probable Plasma membrane-associated coenzyme Q6 reductase PGA3 [Zygosaccharomyces bailii]